jgi:hypothetical protein
MAAHSRLAVRLAIFLLVSGSLSEIFKIAFHEAWPYWLGPRVGLLAGETPYGIPSGHAQIAVGAWGIGAERVKRAWAWAAAGMLAVLIGISRVYQRAHSPLDVMVGWFIGGVTLWAYLRFRSPVEAWLGRLGLGASIFLSLGVSFLLILLRGFFTSGLSGFRIARELSPGILLKIGAPPRLLALNLVLASAGAFFGFALGAAVLGRHGGFSAAGPIWKRAARFLIGSAGALVFTLGINLLLLSAEGYPGSLLRFVQYALIGFWVSAGAPWVFGKLGLSEAGGAESS